MPYDGGMTNPLAGADFIFQAPVADLTDTVGAAEEARRAEREGLAPNRRRAGGPTLEIPEVDLYGGYDFLLVRTALVRARGYSEDAKRPTITSPSDVALLCKHLAYADQEHVVTLSLNAKNECLAINEAFIGGSAQSMVELPHTIKVALLTGALAIVIVHNHPSGVPIPSPNDYVLTGEFKKAVECVGLKFMDHVIVARDGYYSFEDEKPYNWRGRVMVGLGR